MALPELPDDRRAQPRRFVPVDEPALNRRGGTPPARRPGRPPVEEPEQDSRPVRAAAPPPESRRRRAAVPVRDAVEGVRGPMPPVEDPRPAAPERRAPRRAPDPRQSPDEPTAGGRRRLAEPPAAPEQPQRRARRPVEQPAAPPVPGDPALRRRPQGPGAPLRGERHPGRPEQYALAPPVEPQAAAGVDERRNGYAPAPPGRRRPLDGRRAPVEDPSGRAGRPVRRGAVEPGFPAEPPADPETVLAPVDEADTTATESPEFPGRHRRRAGESADERPAAAYRELAAGEGGRKQRTGRRRRSSFWKELPLLVLVALVLTFLIQTFVAKVYVIPSGSMETTLHGCTGCNNDRVLVDKITYRFSDPQPGDVVVFRGPDSWSSEFEISPPSNVIVSGLQQLGSLIGLAPPDEKDFVKRVIAVGGQTVQCCTTNGQVMVDGKPLTEPYIYYKPGAGPPRQDPFGPVTVPAGELWMMGDSRNNSADSRVAGHGAVPVDNVIGKARLIVLPFPRFGWIPAADPQSTSVGMGAAESGLPAGLALVAVLPLMRRRNRLDRLVGADAELRRRLHG